MRLQAAEVAFDAAGFSLAAAADGTALALGPIGGALSWRAGQRSGARLQVAGGHWGKLALGGFEVDAEGRVGEDDVDAVGRAVVAQRARQGVVVADLAGDLDAVQQHVGDAQQVRELLLLDARHRALPGVAILDRADLVAQVLQRAGEEAAGAAGGVEHALAESGIDLVDHELGDGARGVELARVAGALQVLEDLFVEVVEEVALGLVVEVDLVDLVDDLAQQLAGLHVVVGVLEHRLHDVAARVARGVGGEAFHAGEELGVDEVLQLVAGDAFGVRRPVAPAQRLGDGRAVAVVHQFELGFLVVEDLEEEQPAELRQALGVAVDAGVLAHDVLDGFDEGGADCHGAFGVQSSRVAASG